MRVQLYTDFFSIKLFIVPRLKMTDKVIVSSSAPKFPPHHGKRGADDTMSSTSDLKMSELLS